jgi:hypothetical protein
VTDAGLKELAGLRHSAFEPQGSNVTDAGMKEIVGLENLVYLDLYAISE